MALGRSTEAVLFAEELRREIRAIVRDEVAQLDGAHRAYAWMIGDPYSTPPPDDAPPFVVELRCRPVDFLASCVTAPSSTAQIECYRSIDAGATWQSILWDYTTIAAGERIGRGGLFYWEMIETRVLVVPTTEGALPLLLLPGDLVRIDLVGSSGTGIKSLSVQLRVQRVGEYGRRGR